MTNYPPKPVSDIAVFVLKRDVKPQPTNPPQNTQRRADPRLQLIFLLKVVALSAANVVSFQNAAQEHFRSLKACDWFKLFDGRFV